MAKISPVSVGMTLGRFPIARNFLSVGAICLLDASLKKTNRELCFQTEEKERKREVFFVAAYKKSHKS